MDSLRIMIDWGNTLTRDVDLFNYIAYKSGNEKTKWESPDSWKKIRSIGGENYFNKIQDKFFKMSEIYPQSKEVISSFFGKSPTDTQTIIVFDNNPTILLPTEEIQFRLAEALQNKHININGQIVESDKTKIVKTYGIDIAVEDDPRIAISLCAADVKTIVPIRKWNRSFDLNDLRLITKEKVMKKIEENIFFAEDWYEIGIIVGRLVDGK